MATCGLLISCAEQEPTAEDLIPEYLPIESEALADDLVQIQLSMKNALTQDDVIDYVECAVAGYVLSKNYSFARHLRTNVDKQGGIWSADAVYTISPSLPEGLKTIDAEVAAQKCKARGIPTV